MGQWIIKEKPELETFLFLEDEDGCYSACVRQDGCVDFSAYNEPLDVEDRDEKDVERLHICDLDELIERLQALRQKAIDRFGKDWGK